MDISSELPVWENESKSEELHFLSVSKTTYESLNVLFVKSTHSHTHKNEQKT